MSAVTLCSAKQIAFVIINTTVASSSMLQYIYSTSTVSTRPSCRSDVVVSQKLKMAVKFVIVTFALAFCCATEPVKGEDFHLKRETPSGSYFGFELLITQLEILEQKLEKIYILEQKLTKLDIIEQKLTKLDIVEQKLSRMQKATVNTVFESCLEVPFNISRKYQLQPDFNEQLFVGYCEQEKFNGGWLVVQHRFDGSVDFYRNWMDYKNGFGKIDGEFWIGLERLHKLTKDKKVRLMVEIKDYDGNYGYGSYDEFEIGDEDEKYVLKRLSGYSGTLIDSMSITKGRKFTTRDSDNDENKSGNCAQIEKGAWWYSSCGNTNPNGPFNNEGDWKKIYWYTAKYFCW
ncbi:fibrinogen-like protein A [Aedes albopictus]|uniref:Fibrinogen C-terminal domain-containing protein n=1 Tax=Aedes albopictus TaxID=7160 RepID=A0ABM1Z417_AEDAL